MDVTALRPPVLTDPEQTGLVLEVVSIGVHNPLPLPGESSYLYLTCAQGQRYRLPVALHGWATRTLAEHQQRVAAGEVAMLPMTVEFGVRDQQTFARPLLGRR